MIVYRLMFTSGKAYVGQTNRKLQVRISQHRQAVNAGSQLAVHCAWRVYGEPQVSVLCECETQEQLHEAERQFIATLSTISPNGYNLGIGGDTAPSKAPEVAAKIAAKAKGRKHSPGAKAAIGNGSKANWEDPEYRQKVSSAVRKALSRPEVMAKRSEAIKEAWQRKLEAGWTMTTSHREKLAGREFSDEHRQRMSESAKKRVREPFSASTCQILSENAKAQHAKRTPEQKAAVAEKIRQSNKARFAAMTPEQYAAFCELKQRAADKRRANRANQLSLKETS